MEDDDLKLSKLSNNDRNFILNLNNFIQEEISILENQPINSKKERFLIYRHAFDKIINYAQVYRNLLLKIKIEYENCIEEFERHRIDIEKKFDDLTKSETHSKTISNLEKKRNDLIAKFDLIKELNEELNKKLEQILEKNEKYRKKETKSFKFEFINTQKQETQDETNRSPIYIQGLDLDQATNLNDLNNLLKEIDEKIKELTESQSKKYANKEQKINLEKHLYEKIAIRDHHKIESSNIKNKIHLYKIALSTAKDYYNDKTTYSSIQDALSKVILNAYLNKHNSIYEDEVDNGDENGLEHDTEMILDYIERFNEIFGAERYVEAAYFAVAGPKNILRNLEILYRFKTISDMGGFTEFNDPLFAYCNSLIDTVNHENTKPDRTMSIECIKIVLKYNKLDVLSRWIANRKLTFSYEAGKCIEEYALYKKTNPTTSFELALFIYMDCNEICRAAFCLANLGRISEMVDLISGNSNMLNYFDDWLKILKECPSTELANIMVENFNKAGVQVPVDKIVSTLLDSSNAEIGLKFLKDLINKQSNDEAKKDELKKLKTSYDTLMKFSFLAQHEEQFTKEDAVETRDQLHNIYATSKLNKTEISNQDKTKFQSIKSKSKRTKEKTIMFNSFEEMKNTLMEESENDPEATFKSNQELVIEEDENEEDYESGENN